MNCLSFRTLPNTLWSLVALQCHDTFHQFGWKTGYNNGMMMSWTTLTSCHPYGPTLHPPHFTLYSLQMFRTEIKKYTGCWRSCHSVSSSFAFPTVLSTLSTSMLSGGQKGNFVVVLSLDCVGFLNNTVRTTKNVCRASVFFFNWKSKYFSGELKF